MPKYIDLNDFIYPTARLFGERLKALRQAAGLTQADVGKKTRITSAYISLIERGRANPTLDMMVKLADLFDAEVWDMIRPAPKECNGSDRIQNG